MHSHHQQMTTFVLIFGAVLLFEFTVAASATTIARNGRSGEEDAVQAENSNIDSENLNIPFLSKLRPKRWRPGGYNCFFTPMNCDVTGRRRFQHRLRAMARADGDGRIKGENCLNGLIPDLNDEGKGFKNFATNKIRENQQQKGLLRRRSTKKFSASKMPALLRFYSQRNK